MACEYRLSQLTAEIWLRIVRANASARLARQLVLLGLFEEVQGKLLTITAKGGVVIAIDNKQLRLSAAQADCIVVCKEFTSKLQPFYVLTDIKGSGRDHDSLSCRL